MRRLATAAAAAALLAPSAALADQTGFVQVSADNADVEVGGVSTDSDAFELRGTIAWAQPSGVGFQVDATYGEVEDDFESWAIGGHAFVRQADYVFGAFLASGEGDLGDFGHLGYWSGGIEGAWYFDRTTLDAALVYSTDDEDLDISITALELGLTHFFTDRFSIGANAALGAIDDGVDTADGRRFGVNAEFQFPQAPLSIFGSFSHIELDDLDLDADLTRLGVRYEWGGTLFHRNRHGALLRDAGAVALLDAAPE